MNTDERRYGLAGLIGSDLRAKAEWVYGSSGRRDLIKAVFTDGTFAMIAYRLMQWAQKWKLAPLAMVFNKVNVVFGGCIIGRGASFGPGFVMVHSMGIVINSAVRGGRDIKLEHQVTIGAEKESYPVLGDNIFIGAGARILGNVKIGSNVKIGANAVVVTDLPHNCTAVGVPARVVGAGGEG